MRATIARPEVFLTDEAGTGGGRFMRNGSKSEKRVRAHALPQVYLAAAAATNGKSVSRWRGLGRVRRLVVVQENQGAVRDYV